MFLMKVFHNRKLLWGGCGGCVMLRWWSGLDFPEAYSDDEIPNCTALTRLEWKLKAPFAKALMKLSTYHVYILDYCTSNKISENFMKLWRIESRSPNYSEVCIHMILIPSHGWVYEKLKFNEVCVELLQGDRAEIWITMLSNYLSS